MGLPGAAAASHLLQSFLFGVSPFDPLVMALVDPMKGSAGGLKFRRGSSET